MNNEYDNYDPGIDMNMIKLSQEDVVADKKANLMDLSTTLANNVDMTPNFNRLDRQFMNIGENENLNFESNQKRDIEELGQGEPDIKRQKLIYDSTVLENNEGGLKKQNNFAKVFPKIDAPVILSTKTIKNSLSYTKDVLKKNTGNSESKIIHCKIRIFSNEDDTIDKYVGLIDGFKSKMLSEDFFFIKKKLDAKQTKKNRDESNGDFDQVYSMRKSLDNRNGLSKETSKVSKIGSSMSIQMRNAENESMSSLDLAKSKDENSYRYDKADYADK